MSNITFVLLKFAFGTPTWPLCFLRASSLSGVTRDPRFIFVYFLPRPANQIFFPQGFLFSKNEQGILVAIPLATEEILVYR